MYFLKKSALFAPASWGARKSEISALLLNLGIPFANKGARVRCFYQKLGRRFLAISSIIAHFNSLEIRPRCPEAHVFTSEAAPPDTASNLSRVAREGEAQNALSFLRVQ